MANAAILKYTKVVQTTNLSEMQFDLGGFLVGFKISGIKYVHSNKDDFRREDQNTIYASGGYYQEEFFLKYLAKEISAETLQTNYQLKNNSLPLAVSGDTVKVQKLKLVEPFSDFCKVETFSWTYDISLPIIDSNFNIIIPTTTVPGYSVTTNTATIDGHADVFFDHKIGLFVDSNQPDKQQRALLIAKIALNIDRINRDIFSLFTNSSNPDFNTFISSQNSEWTTLPIFSNPTVEDFQEYLINISSFYESAYSNQLSIQRANDSDKLYWLAKSLSVNGLAVISSYDKLKLLGFIANKYFITELNGNELFVLRIFESISNNQIDEFFEGLQSNKFYNEKGELSLFEILYAKVNDIGIGNENLKKMMELLYKKWLLSSYYPYNIDGTVRDELINPSNYNSKVINLNYESGDFLWIFNSSNYDFEFKNVKIIVTEDGYEINPVTGNANPKTYTIGIYGMYQAITIKNTDSNTEKTKFITVNVNGEQKAVLPIFYLKYISDKKETENLITAAELTFDLALTASGIGNLAKLRHLRHLTKLGRVALGLEAAVPGQILISYELAQGVAGVIEVSSSVASILLNYGNTYQDTYCDINSQSYDQEKCEFYTQLNNVVTVMQFFSGALDYVTSRQLRNASKNLLARPIPNDFDPDALLILRKFAGNIAEMKEAFRVRLFQELGDNPAIWQKLNALPTSPIDKQEMFILDFEKVADDVLQSLNLNNGLLIERWSSLADRGLVAERKLISFLSNQVYVQAIIKFYNKPNLKIILEKLSATIRIKFLDEFSNLTDIQINKIAQKPNKLELILSYQKKLKRGHADEMLYDDIIAIIESNLKDIHVALLKIKSETILKNAAKKYFKDINNINIPLQRLQDIQNGNSSIFPFFNSLTDDLRSIFKKSNKLFADIQVYNDNTPIGGVIKENYLSGPRNQVNSISTTFFKEPTNYDNFNIFKKRAKQTIGSPQNRGNDTELKFIFNFLEEHWDSGNRFIINLESTLYACQSCQGYLVYLKQLAIESDKVLEITFKANKNITDTRTLNNVTN